ncbi:hypothetical protein ILYODFUR_001824 [Ilyodon furcidens]|uniref:Uncharacterized protein n=1 Tax=Ilyodon furcidens TaxID=33524 RepID=A0ABV0SI33_9TELE
MAEGFSNLRPPGLTACSATPRSAILGLKKLLCPCGALRFSVRLRQPSFSRQGGAERAGSSEPTSAGVRGQRLNESDPIKHRLRQPWRREEGRGSAGSRAVRFRAGGGWRRSRLEKDCWKCSNVAEGTLRVKKKPYIVSLSMFRR